MLKKQRKPAKGYFSAPFFPYAKLILGMNLCPLGLLQLQFGVESLSDQNNLQPS
jgi:hypothetical protein